MYNNLRNEMERRSLSIKQLSMCMKITERSLRNKINGVTDFTWSEVQRIHSIVAPTMLLEELFQNDRTA